MSWVCEWRTRLLCANDIGRERDRQALVFLTLAEVFLARLHSNSHPDPAPTRRHFGDLCPCVRFWVKTLHTVQKSVAVITTYRQTDRQNEQESLAVVIIQCFNPLKPDVSSQTCFRKLYFFNLNFSTFWAVDLLQEKACTHMLMQIFSSALHLCRDAYSRP